MTTSGTIDLFFNDYEMHNLTIYWHDGLFYEYIFNSSDLVTIELACKSVDATIMWEDIKLLIEGHSITLEYWSGTAWYDIQVDVSDVNGLVSFSGLIMGDYRLDTAEFTIDQPMTTYTTDVFVVADKTVIDIDYNELLAIFGANYPVDLNTITWSMEAHGYSTWYPVTDGLYDGIIVDEVAGTITIYNLVHSDNGYRLCLYDYAGVGIKTFSFGENVLTQINLDAKSISAEFLWDGDGAPVVGVDYELFFKDGIEWISIGIFKTNASGFIFVDGFPIGTYKFDDMTEFSIIAMDVTKTVIYTVESLCVKEKESFSLGFHRDMESKLFFFVFKLKIKLTIVFSELWQIGFFVFWNIPSTFFYASATAQFTL